MRALLDAAAFVATIVHLGLWAVAASFAGGGEARNLGILWRSMRGDSDLSLSVAFVLAITANVVLLALALHQRRAGP